MNKKFWLLVVLLSLCSILLIFFYKTDLLAKESNDVFSSTTYYDNAKSSIVMDLNSRRVLYENNSHERMLPASTTKILTCITAIEHYQLDDYVVIDKEVLKTEGSSIYLEVGDVISVNDLLFGLMLCSGNDAANALALHYSGKLSDFVFLMNETAKKIGMTNSTFENPHGLDVDTKNYTTTYDMALLMSYAMKNPTFRQIVATKSYHPTIISGKKMYFNNKHKLIQQLDNVTGGKTGYTKKAERTLVTTFKNQNFEIVVVTFKCSDDWQVHQSLANYCFTKFQPQKMLSKFEILFSVSNKKYYNIEEADLILPVATSESITYKIIEAKSNLWIVYYSDLDVIAKIEIEALNE